MENPRTVHHATSSKNFFNLCADLPLSLTKQLLPSESVDMLNDLIGSRSTILTEHAWVVNYEPFKAMPSNHVTIVKNNTRGTPVVMATKDANHDITAVSFGVTTVIKRGIMLTIDFYCLKAMQCTSQGNDILCMHLIRHLIVLNQQKGPYKRVVLDVVFDKDLMSDSILGAFRRIDLEDYRILHRQKRIYCTESNAKRFFLPKL